MKQIHNLLLFLIISLTATVASAANTQMNFELTSGHAEQTVKAGETIEPIVFRAVNVDSVVPTLLPGLSCDCDAPKKPTTCTVSGRIPANASDKTYNMKLDVYGVTQGDDGSVYMAITAIPMSSPFEHISGKLDQTLTAGDSIEPIIYRYQSLRKISIIGQPEGITVTYSESDWTFSIYGAPNEDIQDHEFNYTLVVYSTEIDSTIINGKITVKHKPAVTTLNVLQNKSQNVTAGDSIKPIVFKFTNMQYEEVSGIPKSCTVVRNDDEKTVTISGMIPENHNDATYTITVIAHGLDNNESAQVTINVIHKPVAAKVTLISDNASQTVKAGSAIDPLVIKYEHIKNLKPIDFPAGNFSSSQDQDNNTITIFGTVSELAEPGQYKIKIIGEGEENNDTVYVTITVEPQTATIALFSGKETQTIYLGDIIEPVVFKYAYAPKIIIIGSIPKGVEYTQNKNEHTITFSGKINEDNSIREYIFGVQVEGSINTDSAKTKIIVKSKSESSSSNIASSTSQPSSSSFIASSSNIASSSSSIIPSSSSLNDLTSSSAKSSDSQSSSSVLSSSSKEIAASSSSTQNDKSSSSNTVYSSSVIPSSSSHNDLTSSSPKSSDSQSSSSVLSSSSKEVTASSSSTQNDKSSSSSAKSSSSKEIVSNSSSSRNDKTSSSSGKNTKIALNMRDALNFSYANNELTVTIANSSNVRVQLFDMMGHLLETINLSSSASINLGHLPCGAALLRISSNSFVKTTRIIIK